MSDKNRILLDLVCKIDYHASEVMTDLSWLHNIGVLVDSGTTPDVVECTSATAAESAGISSDIAGAAFAAGATVIYAVQVKKDSTDTYKNLKVAAEKGLFKQNQFFTLYIPIEYVSDQDLYNDCHASTSGDPAKNYFKTYLGSGYYEGVVEHTFSKNSFRTWKDTGFVWTSLSDNDYITERNWKCNLDFRETVANSNDKPWINAEVQRLTANEWNNAQYFDASEGTDLYDYNDAKLAFGNYYSCIVTDQEYGNKTWGAFVGKKAVLVPYIEKELFLKIQFYTYNYIKKEKPVYSASAAADLKAIIQGSVFPNYVPKYFSAISFKVNTVTGASGEKQFRFDGKLEFPVVRALWGIDIDAYEYTE